MKACLKATWQSKKQRNGRWNFLEREWIRLIRVYWADVTFIFLFYFWVMAQIQNCVEMGFPALSSLFKCYRMFSSLFMDQINIQSFCQVESELFLQGLPKINADRSPPISHIKRLGGNFCRRGRKRQYKKLITESIPSIAIPDSKLSWIERKSLFIEIWTRPLSMANHSNQKCPCGSERYHHTIVIAGTGSGKSFQVLYHISDSVISLSSSDNDSEGWGN
jgi:hypothetical protein